MKRGAGAGASGWAISARDAPAVSCLAYACCSLSMVLANKLVLSHYNINATFALLLFQTATTVVLLLAARRMGAVDFAWSSATAKRWLPVNLLFLAMLFTGFKSLQLLAVPLVNIFKNLTNAITLFGDWFLFNQRVTPDLLGALALTIVAAVLSGMSDLSFDAAGYAWMALNCLCSSTYGLSTRGVMKREGLDQFGAAFFNNLLGIPLLIMICLANGEIPAVFELPQLRSAGCIAAVLFTGVIGFLLQLASLWCISATSASTQGMVGALNKIPLSVLGIFLFGDVMTWKLAGFISVGLAGGVWFTVAKIKLREREKKPPTSPVRSQRGANGADDTERQDGIGIARERRAGVAALV